MKILEIFIIIAFILIDFILIIKTNVGFKDDTTLVKVFKILIEVVLVLATLNYILFREILFISFTLLTAIFLIVLLKSEFKPEKDVKGLIPLFSVLAICNIFPFFFKSILNIDIFQIGGTLCWIFIFLVYLLLLV